MKRLALAFVAFVVLAGLVCLVFFSASDFRVDDQSYWASLSDFVFMIETYNAQFLGLEPARLTSRRYERVMSHATREAHYEVEEAVFLALERWGSDVEPFLVAEVEAWRNEPRVRAAGIAAARLQHPAAITALDRAVEEGNRWLQVELLEELYKFGPGAMPAMTRTIHDAVRRDLPIPYNILEAIGRSGASADFLLDRLARASTDEEILVLQWPLAYTNDRRAARALFELMHHPTLSIRRRSRDSMSQAMNDAAVDPALDFLEPETDDYIRSWVIQSILADRRAAESPRAVHYLAPLVEDPVLGWAANYALASIATDDALEVLRDRAQRKPARWAISNLEYAGTTGVRLLEDYTKHEDPFVRRQALWKLEEFQWYETAPIFRAALEDPDPANRREAERMLFQTDTLVLGKSFLSWLSGVTGREMRGRIRAPIRRSTRAALGAVRIVHWVGLGISTLLGLLLLIGSLRAFELYKFALVLLFLLVAGLIGDFFLMQDPLTYRLATTSRLALLLGLLFLRDDPLPGETRGRFARLAVRSLWVLAPLLLFFGVPVLAQSLRLALQDFEFMKWVVMMMLILTVLLLEQVVLPWHLFARGSRLERGIILALSIGVVALFVTALWRDPLSGDREALNALLTLPLVGAILFQIQSSRLFATFVEPPELPPAPGRIRIVRDRETVIVKMKSRRSFRGVPQLVIILVGLWFLADKFEVMEGDASALFFLICAAIFGTVVAWLLLAVINPNYTIQIRDGAARSANSFLGGVVGRARWYRRLRLPAFVGQVNLSPSEKRWLARALDPA